MVVFNGFYIGRHSGGYDPFSFDVTDFANPGGRNVLLVRVDATESDGWFYEGAGIYRHVWLVKTNPVHVKQWGTFVLRDQTRRRRSLHPHRTQQPRPGRRSARACPLFSIEGQCRGQRSRRPSQSRSLGEQTCEQKMTVSQPQLWSLEERNLYTLV
jgi:beta-galactosidase